MVHIAQIDKVCAQSVLLVHIVLKNSPLLVYARKELIVKIAQAVVYHVLLVIFV